MSDKADDDPELTPALLTGLSLTEKLQVGRHLRSVSPIHDWSELEFTTPGALGDFPLAAEATYCSTRLREVIDSHRGVSDALEWLASRGRLPYGSTVRHWVLHFPDRVDALDRERTRFDPHGDPYWSVIDPAKIQDRVIVPDPDVYGTAFFVNNELATAIRAANLRGVVVEP